MWPPQLTRRLRVLLHAYPLLELRSWDGQRSPETRHYDSITLAMRVFDYIIESTGLGVDADSDAIFRLLTPLMTQMDIAAGVIPDPELQRQFISILLGRLRNDRDRQRRFELRYKEFSDQQLIERQLEFRMIEEHTAADERVILQLSSEAINLFLNALDLDIEDAQIALEAVIQSQLQRGRFDEATASARDAKFRSIQFEEKINQILRDTRRDISRIDWHERTPKLLREALEHIEGRFRVEKQIADTARQRIDQLEPGSHEAQQVVLIAELMDDCAERHTKLHGLLLDARRVFFVEQDRQAFVPRPSRQLPNLFADALEPILAAPRHHALEAFDGDNLGQENVMSALLGVRAPGVFSLQGFVTALLRPRRDIRQISAPDDVQVWIEGATEIQHFPAEIRTAAQSYFPIRPTVLSVILDQAVAAEESRAMLEYINLSALQAFGDDSPALQVEAIGRPFACHGYWGDDLQLHIHQDAGVGDDIDDSLSEE
ncbi:MAG TPA: hypothetical protein PKK78_15365 [Kouleothrix sp.]|nr:hypothetical protein [Kouleothrix sp.]